jgi:pseudouridine synthase
MARRHNLPPWLRAAQAQNRSPAEADFDWLSRALSRAGVLPKAEAEQAIALGRVRVNGRIQKLPLAAIRAQDRVELDGREVSLAASTLVFVLHKPKGVVTAANDPEGVGTVFDVFMQALPENLHRYGWHAVGRLDRNTTGLLLFTNDEKFVSHVTSPKTRLAKRYLAKVSGQLSDERIAPLRAGITLDDGPCRPAQARIRSPGEVELTLTEGRNHQVKRMLGAMGLPVLELHREAVGGLELDVPVGEARLLSDPEVTEKLQFDSLAGFT